MLSKVGHKPKTFTKNKIFSFQFPFQVLQNFKISLPEGFEEPDIIYEVFGTFSKPIPFIFTPRKEVET